MLKKCRFMHNVLKFGKGFYNIKTIGTVFAMNIIQEGEDTNEAICYGKFSSKRVEAE